MEDVSFPVLPVASNRGHEGHDVLFFFYYHSTDLGSPLFFLINEASGERTCQFVGIKKRVIVTVDRTGSLLLLGEQGLVFCGRY